MPHAPATDDLFAIEVKTAFVQHARAIRRTLVHLGATPQQAEDAFQEAVLSIWDGRPQMENPAAYLMKAARNKWRDMLRSTARMTDLEGEDVPMVADCQTKTPENHVLAHEYQYRVVTALKNLPTNHREAFVLRIHEKFSFGEIAEITGRNESTVRQHYKRAVTMLRTLLTE